MKGSEASILTNALQCKNNYIRVGCTCFEADIAFIFGEGKDQIRVLVDFRCGWTYIKYNNEFLDLSINWQSDCVLKYYEIAEGLRAKYFPNEKQDRLTNGTTALIKS